MIVSNDTIIGCLMLTYSNLKILSSSKNFSYIAGTILEKGMEKESNGWYKQNVEPMLLNKLGKLLFASKKGLKSIRNWYELNGKLSFINILVLSVILVFIDPIKTLLSKLPSDLLQINHSWHADVATFLACGFLLIWGWNFEIRSWGRLFNRLVVTAFLGYIYFVYFREVSNNRFVALYWFQKYYYFDVVIIALLSWTLVPTFKLICTLILKAIQNEFEAAKQKEKKSEKLNWFWKRILSLSKKLASKPELRDINSFIEDIPNDNADQLQRTEYAKILAKKIIELKPKRAFIIGIFGEWGTGKSDFIYRISKELNKKKDVIIVEFNPWRVGSNSSITEDYLQVLSRYLRPYSSRLSNSIGDYAKQFIDKADTTGLAKAASNLLTDTFMPNADIESQYEAIRKEVQYLDKTIVVFIDDLDRLNKEEILETFKLIRNVADFPNTFFVLGLDYDYVMSTAFGVKRKTMLSTEVDVTQSKGFMFKFIDRSNLSYQVNYLEKIFQTTLALPSLPKELVSRIGFNGALEVFKTLDSTYEFNRHILENIFEEILNHNPEHINIRKFKILNNNFSLKLRYFKNFSVDYLELYILSLVEVFCYPTYKFICDRLIILNKEDLIELEKSELIYHKYADFNKAQELELQKRFAMQNSYELFWLVKNYIIDGKGRNLISFRNQKNFLIYTSFNHFGDLNPSDIEKLLSDEIDELSLSKLNIEFSSSGLNRYYFSKEFQQILIEEKFNYIGFKSEETFLKSIKILFILDLTPWEIRNFINSYFDYLFTKEPSFNEIWFFRILNQVNLKFSINNLLKTNEIIANVFVYPDPKFEYFIKTFPEFNKKIESLIEFFINYGELSLILNYSKHYYFYNAIISNVKLSELFISFFEDDENFVILCSLILEFFDKGNIWGNVFNDRVYHISSLLGGLENFKLMVVRKMNDNLFLSTLNTVLQYISYIDTASDIANFVPKDLMIELGSLR